MWDVCLCVYFGRIYINKLKELFLRVGRWGYIKRRVNVNVF